MKGQREYRTKPCPKCTEAIGLTWENHYKCGWDGKPSEKQASSGTGSSVSPPGAQTPVNSLDQKMRVSVQTVASIFDLPIPELRKDIEKYSTIINTLFMAKENE